MLNKVVDEIIILTSGNQNELNACIDRLYDLLCHLSVDYNTAVKEIKARHATFDTNDIEFLNRNIRFDIKQRTVSNFICNFLILDFEETDWNMQWKSDIGKWKDDKAPEHYFNK